MNQLAKELKTSLPSLIVAQKDVQPFFSFIRDTKYITVPENKVSHICSFFLPVHLPSSSLYLTHHRKAKDWIPPGGHVETGEHPLQTARREFKEELDITLTNQKIELFALSIKKINTSYQTCKTHYDFWYAVYCGEKFPFRYDEREFFSASWFSYNDALKQMKMKEYTTILSQFIQRLKLPDR